MFQIILFQIYFRQDVVASRPEGTSWEKVDSEEVLSVSVSPSSMVWAVTWSGGLIVRTGVTWKCPMGKLKKSYKIL